MNHENNENNGNKNNSNINVEVIKPLIFIKKINDKHKIIPLKFVDNTVGAIKHYPSSTKEWSNSVYSYNNNYIKDLPVANKNLTRLLNSYFNLYYSNKNLKSKNKSKRISMRFRRLSLKKIFLSKTELKHTNNRVIITLHVYNEEKRLLVRKLKRLERLLFNKKNIRPSWRKKYTSLVLNNKLNLIDKVVNETPPLNFVIDTRDYYKDLSLYLKEVLLPKVSENKLEKVQEDIVKAEKQITYFENIITLYDNNIKSFKAKFDSFYGNYLRKKYLEKEIRAMGHYLSLLRLNNYKFDNVKMLPFLKEKLFRLYGKKIEFNIINLKTLYMNSDIFTQAIAIKLKNRSNSLLKVLRRSLSIVKLPRINEVVEKQRIPVNVNDAWENKTKNININYIIDNYNYNNDIINFILKELFNKKDDNSLSLPSGSSKLNSTNVIKSTDPKDTIKNIVLDSLKYKRIGGVRLEAKGRLTRRFTASRSVFKVRWKGGLKNIDSSYKGLSSVILRGHVKSNVQYSIINSKTRNGAFGLKGWISGR
jgi:hypothetical protein